MSAILIRDCILLFTCIAPMGADVSHLPRSSDAAALCSPGGGDGDAPGRGLLQELSQGSTLGPVDHGGNRHYR